MKAYELLDRAFLAAKRGNAGTVWTDDIATTPEGRELLARADGLDTLAINTRSWMAYFHGYSLHAGPEWERCTLHPCKVAAAMLPPVEALAK